MCEIFLSITLPHVLTACLFLMICLFILYEYMFDCFLILFAGGYILSGAFVPRFDVLVSLSRYICFSKFLYSRIL